MVVCSGRRCRAGVRLERFGRDGWGSGERGRRGGLRCERRQRAVSARGRVRKAWRWDGRAHVPEGLHQPVGLRRHRRVQRRRWQQQQRLSSQKGRGRRGRCGRHGRGVGLCWRGRLIRRSSEGLLGRGNPGSPCCDPRVRRSPPFSFSFRSSSRRAEVARSRQTLPLRRRPTRLARVAGRLAAPGRRARARVRRLPARRAKPERPALEETPAHPVQVAKRLAARGQAARQVKRGRARLRERLVRVEPRAPRARPRAAWRAARALVEVESVATASRMERSRSATAQTSRARRAPR